MSNLAANRRSGDAFFSCPIGWFHHVTGLHDVTRPCVLRDPIALRMVTLSNRDQQIRNRSYASVHIIFICLNREYY